MTRRLGPYRLTGVATPMAVWALHFVVVYSLVGLGCEHGWHLQRVSGLSLLGWTLLLATLVALGAIAWLGKRAWRGWNGAGDLSPHNASENGVPQNGASRIHPARHAPAPHDPPSAADALHRRQRFLSMATALLAMLAFIAVVFAAVPMFMLPSCT
ncbi:MAG: hypothetical protein M3374_05115 [Pseudomonadota bacterium]|nr:hypothetical protein [Pseudomonadota bacterium]